jgi:hypothetical protein
MWNAATWLINHAGLAVLKSLQGRFCLFRRLLFIAIATGRLAVFLSGVQSFLVRHGR